ncbi:MAG: Diaminopimelate decarboxylase, partial [uncultured Microvirga sp.]
PADRDIAMVFQSYALYPHMSVYENMAFGLKLSKAPKSDVDEAVRGAARILHIDHLLDRKPKALSGGQRQRVAIGRAIVRKPQVFLFDEPLSNLDAALRVRMRYEFARLHDELKTTMVYVTHDQVEAMTLADRIVVLQAGRIEQVGSPMELYQHPENAFVAGFIGSPKINFVPGTVVEAAAGAAGLVADVVGPVCESGDYLALGRDLPAFAAGDLLAVMTAGAYGAVQAGTYNTRRLVPEVLVKHQAYAVVRPRPSYDDLIGLDRLPDWLDESVISPR